MNNLSKIAIYINNKEQQLAAAEFLAALIGCEICTVMRNAPHDQFFYIGTGVMRKDIIVGLKGPCDRKPYQFQDILTLLKDQNITLDKKYDWKKTKIKVSNLAEQHLAAYVLGYVSNVELGRRLDDWDERFRHVYYNDTHISASCDGVNSIVFKDFLNHLVLNETTNQKQEQKNMKKFQIHVGNSLIVKQIVEDVLYRYGYHWNGNGLNRHEDLGLTREHWVVGALGPNTFTHVGANQCNFIIDAAANINDLIDFLEKNKKELPNIANHEGQYRKDGDFVKYGCVEVYRPDLEALHNKIEWFNSRNPSAEIFSVKLNTESVSVNLERIKKILEVIDV